MKRKIYSLIVAFTMVFASSCDLDLLDSPNEVTAATADPSWVLNQVQLSYAGLFDGISDTGSQLTRILSQPNVNYQNAYNNTAMNGVWTTSYATILSDIQFIENELNTPERPIPRHVAMAKVFKAMVLMHLVDHIGDVPYSKALNASDFAPTVDSAEDVYKVALDELVAARAAFALPTAALPTDLYYNNNVTRWQRLVNTLELRYYLNTKLVNSGSAARIAALVAEDNLLKDGDDFVFRYGTSQTNPDSRAPKFDQYGGGGGDYQSTFYMYHLTEAKGFDDPRVRYYLYRQVTKNPTDPDKLRCLGEIAPGHYLAGGFPFCLPDFSPTGRGYWGRDHLNNEGIPPDGFERTMYGLYPAGGRFDDNSATPVNSPLLGAGGAGLQPIMLSAYVDFMVAEAIQTLAVPGDAKARVASGIRKHMNFVRSFSTASSQGAIVTAFQPNNIFNSLVDSYIAAVNTEWDAAPANRKMNLIAREYWLSLFGNGVESYNLHRRTGQPDNMQPGLAVDPGLFPRSFLYPNVFTVTNKNAPPQKANLGQRVFWDTNPEGNGWIN